MRQQALSDAERTAFARNGFVVLHDVLPDDLVEPAYEAVAAEVPEALSDSASLVDAPEDRHYWDDLDDMTPFYRLNDRLLDYAAALVGDGRIAEGEDFAQVAVRYPSGAAPRDPDSPTTSVDGNAHVDLVGPEGEEIRPFAIGVTTYLNEVRPRSGGLTVWPGTHWRVDELLADDGFGRSAHELADAVLGDDDPFEITGPGGTVVLWHPLLVHTGGLHLGRRPRVATFTRFGRENEMEYAETHGDPFAGWDGIEG